MGGGGGTRTHDSADMRRRLRHAAKNPPWISIGPQIGPRQLETDPLKPSGRIETFELIEENLVDALGLEPGTPCMLSPASRGYAHTTRFALSATPSLRDEMR
jgi:hypothetical protein